MRLAFMGTPAFALPALEALIAAGHEIAAVYSQPPRPAGRGMKLQASPVQLLAEKHGIPVRVPVSLKSPEARAEFAALRLDAAAVAAYGLLLPKAILDAPRFGCLNIHPSELPRWRGAAPIQRTLMAGDTTTATCIMRMDEGLDTGPVLLREPFAIAPTMDAGALHDALALRGAALLLRALEQLEAGTAQPVAQPTDCVTYAAKITKADRAIDWSQTAPRIVNHLRGLSPGPAATATIGGETVKCFAGDAVSGDAKKPPGVTLDDQLTVNTGDGTAVRLTDLQRPGRNRQAALQFLQAFPVDAGVKID